MRRHVEWLVVAVALAAVVTGGCNRGTEDPCKRKGIRCATGAMVLEPAAGHGAGRELDVAIATEAEVMVSGPVLERAFQLLGRSAGDAPALADELRSSIRVARRRDSRIVDVTVAVADPGLAVELCNAVLEAYMTHRLDLGRADAVEQMRMLEEELDRLPPDATPDERDALLARLTEVRLTAHSHRSDVRILDRCRIPVTPGT